MALSTRRFFLPLTVPLVLVLVIFFGCWSDIAGGAPAGAEVEEFPGFNGTLPSKHYAGYIPLRYETGKKYLYYYFTTSERNPEEDPVMLFITGGPGCSGLISLASILGPFKVEKNADYITSGTKINLNPYAWTKMSSIIFVDAPVFTGYSYVETSQEYDDIISNGHLSSSEVFNIAPQEVIRKPIKLHETFATDDSETVSDLYEFIIKWFLEFPEFLSNPFYLAGISYSGVHVPALAQEIVSGIEAGVGPDINFKGYTLGNPVTDIVIDQNAKFPASYHMGLISEELYEDLTTSCNGKYWNNDDPECQKNIQIFNEQTVGVNEEHAICLPCHTELGLGVHPYEEASHLQYRSLGKKHKNGIYCHDYNERVRQLFNLQSSREKVHAHPIELTGEWVRCLDFHNYTRNLWNLESLLPMHKNLTMKGYRAFIYCGDHDLQVPPASSLQWIKLLNYSIIEGRRPWFVEDQIAGYMIQYDHNMLFATFKGAGHVVPEYMPREAFIAHERWLSGSNSL